MALTVIVLLSVASSAAAADADTVPLPMFSGSVKAGGGTVRIDATEKSSTSSARPARSATVVTQSRYLPKCWIGAEPVLAATASCEPEPCRTDDGRAGEIQAEQRRELIAGTGTRVTPWTEIGAACIAKPAPRPSLASLVEREFRSLRLPGLAVRTDPAGWTLVNFSTGFVVERGVREFDLGPVLGQRVRVSVVPVRYRWSFGDGVVVSTAGRGGKAPARRVWHTFAGAGQVGASVTVTYRASFRVAGGPAREIPGVVSVAGPATALVVAQARSELVAGPR